jgi:hypothetical protein
MGNNVPGKRVAKTTGLKFFNQRPKRRDASAVVKIRVQHF